VEQGVELELHEDCSREWSRGGGYNSFNIL
jgi:hypothetical protein